MKWTVRCMVINLEKKTIPKIWNLRTVLNKVPKDNATSPTPLKQTLKKVT